MHHRQRSEDDASIRGHCSRHSLTGELDPKEISWPLSKSAEPSRLPQHYDTTNLTFQEFVDKWRKAELQERSAAQEHLIDLCREPGHPTEGRVRDNGDRCYA